MAHDLHQAETRRSRRTPPRRIPTRGTAAPDGRRSESPPRISPDTAAAPTSQRRVAARSRVAGERTVSRLVEPDRWQIGIASAPASCHTNKSRVPPAKACANRRRQRGNLQQCRPREPAAPAEQSGLFKMGTRPVSKICTSLATTIMRRRTAKSPAETTTPHRRNKPRCRRQAQPRPRPSRGRSSVSIFARRFTSGLSEELSWRRQCRRPLILRLADECQRLGVAGHRPRPCRRQAAAGRSHSSTSSPRLRSVR